MLNYLFIRKLFLLKESGDVVPLFFFFVFVFFFPPSVFLASEKDLRKDVVLFLFETTLVELFFAGWLLRRPV